MLPDVDPSTRRKVSKMKTKGAKCKLCGQRIRVEIRVDGTYEVVCGDKCPVNSKDFITFDSALEFLSMWKKEEDS